MPANTLTTVTDATFADLVLGNPLPVVLDVWAEWCPPCRPVAQSLSELAGEFTVRLVIAQLNADENPETTRNYRVLSMPTLLFFRRGVVVSSLVGARPKAHLRRTLEAAFIEYANH